MAKEQDLGNWSKKYDVGGITFSSDPVVHGPTGIITSFEKRLGDGVEIVTRYDTALDEQSRRWIMAATFEDGRNQRTLTTEHNDMFGTTLQFHDSDTAVSSLKVRVKPEAIILNPEMFRIEQIRIVYAQSGTFSHVDFGIASPSMFNEEEIRSQPIEENLAELASIFHDAGDNPESPFYTPPEEDEATFADVHMVFSGFLAKGKLLQWTEEQKARVDDDLAMVTAYLDEAFGEEVPSKQLHALASYLIPSLIRALPDEYVALDGEEREKVFDKALMDAAVEVLRFYDRTVQQKGEYTVSLFENPENPDEHVFVAFPGHTIDADLFGVDVQPITGGPATDPFQYEDYIFVMSKEDEKIRVSTVPVLDQTKAFTFKAPQTINIEAIQQNMRSDSPMDWQSAVAEVPLGVDYVL